jgi:hypothetical protein
MAKHNLKKRVTAFIAQAMHPKQCNQHNSQPREGGLFLSHVWPVPGFYLFFILDIFFIYISNVSPFPSFFSENPLSTPPPPLPGPGIPLSTEEWIQKMWYINTMEYNSAIKNNEYMKFLGKWMDLEDIILNEVTQSQKNTRDMHSVISGY